MEEKKGISHGHRFPRVYRPGGAGEGMGSFWGWGIELRIIDVNRFSGGQRSHGKARAIHVNNTGAPVGKH